MATAKYPHISVSNGHADGFLWVTVVGTLLLHLVPEGGGENCEWETHLPQGAEEVAWLWEGEI